MSLPEQITADLKSAMLRQDSAAVSVLRMLKSELKNAEIAVGAPLNDEQALQVIRKEAKKRGDAAEAFASAGHPDRAEQEKQEAALLGAYLPAQADPAAITAYAKEFIATLETSSAKDKGTVMKAVIAKFAGTADGRTVSEIVNSLLS